MKKILFYFAKRLPSSPRLRRTGLRTSLILSLVGLNEINCSDDNRQRKGNELEQSSSQRQKLDETDQKRSYEQKTESEPETKEQRKLNVKLWRAMGHGDLQKVLEALSAGANVNAKDYNGFTALMQISPCARIDIIKLLINAGADIYAEDNYSNTALMRASFNACKETVELLIKYGADVNAKNEYGQTALMKASMNDSKDKMNGLKDIVELLIINGADIDAEDEDGKTALMYASRNGHKNIAELLINAGADIDTEDEDGKTALIWASSEGHEETVQLLKYWAPYSKEYYEDKANGFKKYKDNFKKIKSELSPFLIDDLCGLIAEYLANPIFMEWMEIVHSGNKSGNKPISASSSSNSFSICSIS